jgi:cyclopropane fatty-acyl-phospholipid synthase-like methyltransferase
VRHYYSGFGEWDRLEGPEGSLELARSMTILDQHLLAGSRVLDLGGGPGRYSFELARRGHSVVLADLSPALIEQARARLAELELQDRIESIDEVNAEDLGRYASESFDAVVAFGPFYHFLLEDERSRAACEMARVLRAGGLAFVAFVPRTSGIAGLIERAARRPEQVSAETLRVAAETGVFRNASNTGFQEGYYAMPGEIEALLADAGFDVVASVSLRSIAYGVEKDLDALDHVLRAEVDRLIVSMSRRPEVIATSGHAVVIARRRAHEPS